MAINILLEEDNWSPSRAHGNSSGLVATGIWGEYNRKMHEKLEDIDKFCEFRETHTSTEFGRPNSGWKGIFRYSKHDG